MDDKRRQSIKHRIKELERETNEMFDSARVTGHYMRVDGMIDAHAEELRSLRELLKKVEDEGEGS